MCWLMGVHSRKYGMRKPFLVTNALGCNCTVCTWSPEAHQNQKLSHNQLIPVGLGGNQVWGQGCLFVYLIACLTLLLLHSQKFIMKGFTKIETENQTLKMKSSCFSIKPRAGKRWGRHLGHCCQPPCPSSVHWGLYSQYLRIWFGESL